MALYSINPPGNDCIPLFCGDGDGDFEERDTKATIEVVKSYIVYCQVQIKLAEQYIKKEVGL